LTGATTVSYSRTFCVIQMVQHLVFLCVAVAVGGPEFTEQIENITVPAGRNVKLSCSVKNLGTYKVRKSLKIRVCHRTTNININFDLNLQY
jgi:hypothetical protein